MATRLVSRNPSVEEAVSDCARERRKPAAQPKAAIPPTKVGAQLELACAWIKREGVLRLKQEKVTRLLKAS
jgi:hypothetical protein